MKDMVGINQRTINGLFGLFLPSYSKPRCKFSGSLPVGWANGHGDILAAMIARRLRAESMWR